MLPFLLTALDRPATSVEDSPPITSISQKRSQQPQRWQSNKRLVMSKVIQTRGGIRATSIADRAGTTAPAVRPVGPTVLERPLTMYAVVNGQALPGPGVVGCCDARLSLEKLWNDARPRCEQARTANAARNAPDAALQKVGARTLVAARQAVGRVILNTQGCVLLCYEHGCYANGIDRWRPMVCAALDQALVWIATRPGGPHTVFGRVAERGGPTTFDLSRTCGLLAQLAVGLPGKVSAVACNGPLPTDLAQHWCGLQLADIVAQAMGPRGSGRKALGQPAAESRNRQWLDQRYAVLSALPLAHPGANGTTVAIGAVDETYGEVLKIVREQACGGAPAARMTLNRLQTQWVNRLPPHTLRCSVEGSVFLGSKVL